MNFAAWRKKRKCGGQVLSEYAFMLITCVVFAAVFFVLFAALAEHGARLVCLVSWEPDPPNRTQLESIMKGNL